MPSSSISTGTSLPSSSLADIFVSSSLFSTLIPVSCGSSVGSTGLTFESSTVVLSSVSDPLSSLSFSWPFTGTSISTFPSGRSSSSITTVIGPSTSVPGVSSISPVPGLITAGTSLPSSSLADTFVSSSGLFTITPVPCFSSVGSTGFLLESSTLVSELLSSLPVSWPFTGTSSVVESFGRSGSSTVTSIGPSTFSPGVTRMLPSSSILTGTLLPSSSLADTFVSSLGFLTI